MRKVNRLAALILAGGYSSRAQAFKPLLPLGNATIIEQAINNFRRAGIKDITVVVGHRAEELRSALAPLPVKCVYNAHYAAGMFSSVLAGVRSFGQGTEAFFLLPVDMPLVGSHTLRLLYRALNKSQADVIYPVFQGRRGHPPLITARCIPDILASDITGSLRPILQRHAAQVRDVAVMDEGILLDADTPEDYRIITEHYRNRDVPSLVECDELLKKLQVQERIVRHGQSVAKVAHKLAACLNQAGLAIDVNIVTAAAKLHDLGRGQADHARIGAKILKRSGYPRIAKIVTAHHDIEYQADSPPDEAAIVYLADKLVKEGQFVTIDERFQVALEKYAANTEVQKIIMKRRADAQNIGRTVERIIGVSLPEIISSEC